MSLWEKWEREKLEKMGIKVERKSDVKIHNTRQRHNLLQEAWFVLGALVICFSLAFAAVVFFSGSRWSDTYIVRLLVERNDLRSRQAERERQ